MAIEKILKFIWNEFIYGGHLSSLGAISIALITMILLKIEISWECLIAIYLGAEIIYLYNRCKEIKKDFLINQEKVKYFQKYIPLFFFLSILVFTGILIQELQILIFGLLLIFLGLLYTIFFKGLTKKIIGFKNFFVSFCWATIIIFVFLFSSHYWSISFFLIFIFVWISVFIQEVLLDMRDVKEDKEANLLTLPIILEKKPLVSILGLLTILANIPIFYGIYFSLLPMYSLILTLTIPYNFFIFKNINEIYRNYKYVGILIDGEKILWGILVLILYRI